MTCSSGGDPEQQNRKALPAEKETTATYTPAVGDCLPLNASLDLKRLTLDYQAIKQGNVTSMEFVVLVEPGFPEPLEKELLHLGHRVKKGKQKSSNVSAVGWTMYTTIGGIEKSAVNSSTWF